MVNQAAPAGSGRALGHSEHRIQRALQTPWSSPSLTRDADPGRRPEHYLQGRCRALTAHAERGSPTWHRPLNEGPVIGTVLSGLAPAPLANEGWPGYEAPLTKGVDEDAVLGMRLGSRHGAT